MHTYAHNNNKNTYKNGSSKTVHRASIGHQTILIFLNTLTVKSSVCTEYGNGNTHSTQNRAHTDVSTPFVFLKKSHTQIPLER